MTVPDPRPAMPPSRRALLTTALASAALGAAGCEPRANAPLSPSARGLDPGKLTQGFAPLAARAAPAVFNLGVMTLDTLAVWCADDNRRFPMQGLVTAPVAAAALAEVDAGRLKLNDAISIRDVDLSAPPSRINRVFSSGAGHIEVRAADLIALAVQENDNTAADVLMKRIGGPGAVTAWLQQQGIKEMRVDRYQREIQTGLFGMESFRPAWKEEAAWAAARASVPPPAREGASASFLTDPRDTTSAEAALNFLNQLSGGTLLSRSSTSLLLRLMSATAGPNPLRGGLPAHARLAQQSGASPTDLGLTPAANAMGVVTLPNNRRFVIAVFLAGSTATAAQRDDLIARAARLTVSALS